MAAATPLHSSLNSRTVIMRGVLWVIAVILPLLTPAQHIPAGSRPGEPTQLFEFPGGTIMDAQVGKLYRRTQGRDDEQVSEHS